MKKKWLLVIAAILVLIIILLLRSCGNSQSEPTQFEREMAAKLGQLEGKSAREIQDELNRIIEEGMFHISINTNPVFKNGREEGSLHIENVPGNHYLMRVEIFLEESGESIYSTKYIEPNYYIQKAVLNSELPRGEYPATAVFTAFDKETLEEIGTTSCKINISVLN